MSSVQAEEQVGHLLEEECVWMPLRQGQGCAMLTCTPGHGRPGRASAGPPHTRCSPRTALPLTSAPTRPHAAVRITPLAFFLFLEHGDPRAWDPHPL